MLKRTFFALTIAMMLVMGLAGCATQEKSNDSGNIVDVVNEAVNAQATNVVRIQDEAAEAIAELREVSYPSAWVIGVNWALDGTRVQVLSLPDRQVEYRIDGVAIAPGDPAYPIVIEHDPVNAVVMLDGVQYEVATMNLLVNLPDLLDFAIYDVLYAYGAPSDCVGIEIPGLTGCQVDGYANIYEVSDYLDTSSVAAVPCAYGTYLKLRAVEPVLAEQGLKLLVWDCYRPYRGSVFISDKFTQAYYNNYGIQQGTGGWDLAWYAANGPSGHNFGTDIDLAVVAMDGTPIAMPSHFDAFDPSAHLTVYQLNSYSITESDYTDAVASNAACVALHRAFTAVGFSEVASEWWHFGDDETQAQVASIVGGGGMDWVVNP